MVAIGRWKKQMKRILLEKLQDRQNGLSARMSVSQWPSKQATLVSSKRAARPVSTLAAEHMGNPTLADLSEGAPEAEPECSDTESLTGLRPR